MSEDSFKIAIVGNMNNNHFGLARYLYDLGYSIHLFVFKGEPLHFRPENDTFQESDFNITVLDWGLDLLHEVSAKTIKQTFSDYPVIVAEGIAPGFLDKGRVKMNVFTPYGGDIYMVPFFVQKFSLRSFMARFKRLLLSGTLLFPKEIFARHQRNSIKASDAIVAFSHERETDLGKLKVLDKWSKVPMPMIHIPTYSPDQLEKHFSTVSIFEELKFLESHFDFLFLNHSRQYWMDHGKGIVDQRSNKGNDRLIKGFARYLKSSSKRSCLILLEYGPDVGDSKRLIRELGIEKNVHWFGILPRKEIMVLISKCHIICNAFVNSWVTNGVIFESMSMGKPIMGFRDDRLYNLSDYNLDTLYPMINAKEPEEISDAFCAFENNPQLYKQMGEDSRKWYQKEIVEKSLSFFKEYLETKRLEHFNPD